ncbi:MAG: histidinol-phosphatase [Bacteroidales bacterium]|nr:histidinol-phosphatase [Bacteroidales bacterium]
MHSNYHTHSCYCDGKATPREMVEFAVAHGFDTLGFSGHGPLPFKNTFSITDYEGYCREVRALGEEYKDRIEIRLGLEIDYVPGMCEDFAPLIEKGGLDYVIGSVHLIPSPNTYTPLPPSRGDECRNNGDRGEECVNQLWFIDGPKWETYDDGLQRLFGGDIRRGVRAYFHQQNAMIERNRPTIVGHPDKIAMHNRDRYFHEDEPWYEQLALETLSLIHECGLICEVNTRGIYKGRHPDYYPSRWLIRQMKQWRIPLLVSTDAHAPEDLLHDEGAYDFLREIEYPCVLTHIDF